MNTENSSKKIYFTPHPTAEYIHFTQDAEHGSISPKEKKYLRALAQKVAEISANPQQEEKRNLWYRHNKLEKVRPMVLVFPEGSWIEIIDESQLEVQNPYWKEWEWYFKHLIYNYLYFSYMLLTVKVLI